MRGTRPQPLYNPARTTNGRTAPAAILPTGSPTKYGQDDGRSLAGADQRTFGRADRRHSHHSGHRRDGHPDPARFAFCRHRTGDRGTAHRRGRGRRDRGDDEHLPRHRGAGAGRARGDTGRDGQHHRRGDAGRGLGATGAAGRARQRQRRRARRRHRVLFSRRLPAGRAGALHPFPGDRRFSRRFRPVDPARRRARVDRSRFRPRLDCRAARTNAGGALVARAGFRPAHAVDAAPIQPCVAGAGHAVRRRVALPRAGVRVRCAGRQGARRRLAARPVPGRRRLASAGVDTHPAGRLVLAADPGAHLCGDHPGQRGGPAAQRQRA